MCTKALDVNGLTSYSKLDTHTPTPQSHSIYDELSDGELRELWEDMIADQVINEQKRYMR